MQIACSLCAAVVVVALLVTAVGQARAEDKAAPGPPAKIVVEAGDSERIDTPVSVSLEGICDDPGKAKLIVVEIRDGKRLPVPSQIEAGEKPRLWWILAGTTPAKAKRTYELVAGEPVAAEGVTVDLDDKALEIGLGKTKVVRYNHAPVPPPQGVDKKYTRGGFIHPLRSPRGIRLTQIHPRDHYHHLGLWHPWTRTKFEGRRIDFWNLKNAQGTVRFVRFASKAAGPVFGGFRAIQQHVVLRSKSGGEKVALNEKFDVRVWNLRSGKGYILDCTTSQRCASDSPLELAAYRYGGFGFRGNEQWNYRNSNYLTSEGKTRKNGHGTRSRWCIVYGATRDGPAGIVFMSNPANREHPEPMRIWNDSPNIFFNYCPIQKKPWTLEPGNDYVLRYRLYVYDGKVDAKAAERLWHDFAHPPKVTVSRVSQRAACLWRRQH